MALVLLNKMLRHVCVRLPWQEVVSLSMQETLHHQAPDKREAADGLRESAFLDAVSPSMKAVEEVIRELAHSSVPVLLIGEKGTGKRTMAERIHLAAGREKLQFCFEPCASLVPERLSALATSAATLYLEEICELSAECQVLLPELLGRPNGNGSGSGKVRVICGSSHDVEGNVRSGAFREDLYYRLSGVCLRIPPLRQRKEDIPGLVDYFLSRYSAWYGRPIPPLSDATRQLLTGYSWPGNLPELEEATRAIVAVGNEAVVMGGLRSLLKRADHLPDGEKVSLKDAARAASREAEKELILKVLARTRWNRRRAAQELQISYKALLYKLKQIGFSEYGTT